MKVKVCGITRSEDARLAADLGAWAIGFIFHPKSPRFVQASRVQEVLGDLKGSKLKTVGVFVDSPVRDILEVLHLTGLNSVQLHGNESPVFCQALKAERPSLMLIKAFRPRSADEIETLHSFSMCDYFLIDSFVEGTQGGTGAVADWTIARQAQKFGPVILAGGLSEKNLEKAAAEVKPAAIDLSSSLESSPGIKSHDKLKSFFKVVERLGRVA